MHLRLAAAAADQLDLSYVHWLVTGQPVHKPAEASSKDRLEMTRLALQWLNDPRMVLDDREVQWADQGLSNASYKTIESFRNELFDGYKDGSGMPPELTVQIPLMEEALVALGVTVWPMVEYEADDALASAAAVAGADQRVERVLIVTPDKDLGQCVVGDRVVQFDRRKGLFVNEAGVVDKFGVPPESIADWLALVGDTADGIPGLPGWGAKSTSSVLARYGHLEEIPDEAGRWDVPGLRGAAKLAGTLAERRDDAMLFRTLATVVTDVDVGSVDDWEWSGAAPEFSTLCDRIGAPHLVARVERLNR